MKTKILLIPVLMMASTLSHAVEVSGYVQATNNFMWRGISLSQNGAAVQSQIHVQADSGLYTTLWASNTSLEGGGGAGSGLEGNLYVGYTNSTGDFSYDVGYLRYFYPGADNKNGGAELSFNEVYAFASYKGFRAGVSYSDDFFAETGATLYYEASYEHSLVGDLTGRIGVGYLDFDEESFMGNGDDGFANYSIGLSHPLPFENTMVSAAWTGVDSDGKDAFEDGVLGINRFVLTFEKAF